MKNRSRSVFQNYDKFEAWQQLPDLNHCNLLHKLNTNLSSYQNKYKKYMHLRQDQLKQNNKLFIPLQTKFAQKFNPDVPFLPQIHSEHKSVLYSQDLKPKVYLSCQKQLKYSQIQFKEGQRQLRDSEIFCQRSNNSLKLKTISFDKEQRIKYPVQRRKYSLREVKKGVQRQRFFNKQNAQLQQKEPMWQSGNCDGSTLKIYPPNKSQQYQQLRYRLKRAASKSRRFGEQRIKPRQTKQTKQTIQIKQTKQSRQLNQINKLKQTNDVKQVKQSLFFKKHKRLSSIMKDVESEIDVKTSQFSDKKFYQQNIRNKYKLHR